MRMNKTVKHKTMAEIILYLTKNDAESIVEWLNGESDIAWIVKESQEGKLYRWKAVHSIDAIQAKKYCLWKIGAGDLRIPSGNHEIEDTVVLDPFRGWEQRLNVSAAETPWFGAAAPETYTFTFLERGKEHEDSIGRSGFNWIGNYFSEIGNSAPDECKKWWERLKRHIKKNSTGIPWPGELGSGKTGAYAFPEAYDQLLKGRAKDVNP
ncbi:hypothetical protein [Neptunomonas sp.]